MTRCATPRRSVLLHPPVLGLLLAFVATAALPARAGTSAMNTAGFVHTVTVENRSLTLAASGTRLVHRMQSPAEAIQTLVIPGTDDTIVDTEPSISIFPDSGLPVIVWSRKDGTDYEIAISYFDGTRWSQARTLTTNSLDDRRPQTFIGPSGYLHIVWTAGTEFDGTPAFYECVLDWKGLILVAPTRIFISTTGSVESDRGSEPTLDAAGMMIAIDASTKSYARVFVFGGMDEPIPVDQRIAFEITGTAGVQSARVEAFGGMATLTVLSGTRLYYSMQTASGWTPLRSILLDGMTLEQAELMVKRVASTLPIP